MVSRVPRLLAGANWWCHSGQGQETRAPGPCVWNPPRTTHLGDAVGWRRSDVPAHLQFCGHGLGLPDGPDVPRTPVPEKSRWPHLCDLRPMQWRGAGLAPDCARATGFGSTEGTALPQSSAADRVDSGQGDRPADRGTSFGSGDPRNAWRSSRWWRPRRSGRRGSPFEIGSVLSWMGGAVRKRPGCRRCPEHPKSRGRETVSATGIRPLSFARP